MGYKVSSEAMDKMFQDLKKDYTIFAPKVFKGGGHFSDTDTIRYAEVNSISEIEFDKKSSQSFKEAVLPITQVLFYYTEDQVKESDSPRKGQIVFLRSCDMHAVKRLDQIYLHNGPSDFYYKRLREKVHFVLIGCPNSFENCFCVDMGANRTDDYDMAIEPVYDGYLVDSKLEKFSNLLEPICEKQIEVTPAYVEENEIKVNIPNNLSAEVAKASMWREYDSRCIDCGRCNFVCPSCTCNSMQDVFYTDNARTGERRRVWASCMVAGYTDVAGGGEYRQKNGDRMRFKTLHKVLDYNQRFGHHMCTGCGRCDDVCPEYISFSNIINKLEDAMEEIENA